MPKKIDPAVREVRPLGRRRGLLGSPGDEPPTAGRPTRNPPRFISSRHLGEVRRFTPSTRRRLVPIAQSACLTHLLHQAYVGWPSKPLTSGVRRLRSTR